VLSLVLDSGVADRRLATNPARGVKLPRVVHAERVFLTHREVHDLAALCAQVDPAYGIVVKFLAYTGVRFGELAALRVRSLDFQRRRASIIESVTVVRGVHRWGTPKGHERRDVPIGFLADELAAHIVGKAPDDLVFPGNRAGRPLRSKVLQDSALTRAAAQIGKPGLTPHGLRHTAASLAIASGADIKVVQQMLGHKSATMTLDLYGYLFSDRLDTVGDALAAVPDRGRVVLTQRARAWARDCRTAMVVRPVPPPSLINAGSEGSR
jgi:integrase